MKKNKNILTKISSIKHYLICFLLLFSNSSLIVFANNFGNINAAEYISENMVDCKINDRTGRVYFEMSTRTGRPGWMSANYWAVSALMISNQNKSMYFSYEDNSDTVWVADETIQIDKCNVYGFGLGNVTYMPLNIKISYGSMSQSDFDVTLPDAKNPDSFWTIISETYASDLCLKLNVSNPNDLLGKEITIPTLKKKLYIKAVCKDRNLMSDYTDQKFIISNYFAFTDKLSSEKIIFKADPKNTGTNFTIFRNLFYSTAWQIPFASNENYFSLLTAPGNEWICNQAEKILFSKTPNLSFLSIIGIFVYFLLGYLISRKKTYFIYGKFVSYLILVSIFLFSFWCSCFLVNSLIIGDIHFIGRSLSSTLHEVISLIVFILGIIVFNSFKSNKQIKDKLNENENFFEVHI